MNMIADFFTASVISLLFQNVVFSRALGIGRLLSVTEKKTNIALFSGTMTSIMVLSSVLAWASGFLPLPLQYRRALEPLINIMCILVIMAILMPLVKKFKRDLYLKIQEMFIPASINYVILGTLILASRNQYSLLEYLGLSLGSGIGFTLAAVIVYYGKKHIAQLNIPDAFKGLPIQLLYVGILSLAIYGFIGKSILL